jgi:hypothetical protein
LMLFFWGLMLKARAVVGHLPDLNYLGVVGFRLPCG